MRESLLPPSLGPLWGLNQIKIAVGLSALGSFKWKDTVAIFLNFSCRYEDRAKSFQGTAWGTNFPYKPVKNTYVYPQPLNQKCISRLSEGIF